MLEPRKEGQATDPVAAGSCRFDTEEPGQPKERAMKQHALAGALCAIVLAVTVTTGAAANEDAYPSRHVSIIIQTAAGSGPDVIARIVADRLAQSWGQQVAIINRNGAAGLVAAQAAATAPADGYTLYMPTSTALVILPETQPKLPVNFDRDFVPIGLISQSPMIIAVSPALGVDTLAQFIALAKKRPGEIFYAANNRGSFPHLTGEFFRHRAGIDLTFVPYPGAAAALKDVMGKSISMMIEGPSALSGALQGGVIKALAVTSATRLPNFPDVPTVAETIPDFRVAAWFALMARAGTPHSIIQKVNLDLQAILDHPAVREKFAALGVYPLPKSPAETMEFIRSEQQLWKPVIKEAGLTLQ
jgi:tripartite-type tricarboxylate transporter receptor subunit TctC